MARYIVEVQTSKVEEAKGGLRTLRFPVLGQALNFLTVEMPPEAVEKVRALPGVVAISPDRPVRATQLLVPVDKKLEEFKRLSSIPFIGPAMAFKYVLEADSGKKRVPTSESRKMVGADVADADGIAGKGIRVAVLDTGTDYGGIQGPFMGGKSSVEGQLIAADENGHGTHVQTTISGRPVPTPHGRIQGVAIDADVAAFKVLGYGLGAGTTSSILRGIADAVEWGADIVSMSLGGPEAGTDDPENRLITALTKQGMIFVVACGNSGPDPMTVGTPGDGPDSLTVGAVDINGVLAPFSSRGPCKDGRVKPDVVAPGVNILSSTTGLIALMQLIDGFKLGAISGTSMATPHCSGVVALAQQYALQRRGRKLTTDEIKAAMALYGDSREQSNDIGWGLITYPILKRFVDERP